MNLQNGLAFPINQDMQPLWHLASGQDFLAIFEFLLFDSLTQIFEEIRMVHMLKLWDVEFEVIFEDLGFCLVVTGPRLVLCCRLLAELHWMDTFGCVPAGCFFDLELSEESQIDDQYVSELSCYGCEGSPWSIHWQIILQGIHLAQHEFSKAVAIGHGLYHNRHISKVWTFQLDSHTPFHDDIHIVLVEFLLEDLGPRRHDHVACFSAYDLSLRLR